MVNYDNVKTLNDLDLNNKTVVLRVDFNVPIKNGNVDDATRVTEALPTIKYLLDKNCKIVALSHLGKVKSLEDKNGKRSLKPVHALLQQLLPNVKIEFIENNVDKNLPQKIQNLEQGSIILLENTRYNDVDDNGEVVKKESKNNSELGKFWASLGDVFVNDAFGTAHRAHASNVGIASNIQDSCVGFLVEKELKNLSKALKGEHPIVAIFGGAKVSDKLASIENIGSLADTILIGGGMGYTFLKAKGKEVGESLVEVDLLETAKNILADPKLGSKIVLPVDSVTSIPANPMEITSAKNCNIDDFTPDISGYDIGEKTRELFAEKLKTAKTIIWNGPMGVFENPIFKNGTDKVCEAIANVSQQNGAFSVVGGGDSASAANKSGFKEKFSHISTGGGASLDFFSGKDLPGISAIKKNN